MKRMQLTQRSQEKELLDLGSHYYSENEFTHCQRILFKINRLLGIYRDTVYFLKKFPDQKTLLDVGCGGGLFLLHLSKQFPERHLIGQDISAEAIHLAQQSLLNFPYQNGNVTFQLKYPNEKIAEKSVDVILTTLVCHHIDDEELIDFLSELYHGAKQAVIIHDLHRHFFSAWIYKIMSPLFRNRLISHDGLISIKKGFTKNEWKILFDKANIKNYQISWRFPFRWRIYLWKK